MAENYDRDKLKRSWPFFFIDRADLAQIAEVESEGNGKAQLTKLHAEACTLLENWIAQRVADNKPAFEAAAAAKAEAAKLQKAPDAKPAKAKKTKGGDAAPAGDAPAAPAAAPVDEGDEVAPVVGDGVAAEVAPETGDEAAPAAPAAVDEG